MQNQSESLKKEQSFHQNEQEQSQLKEKQKEEQRQELTLAIEDARRLLIRNQP